MKCSLPILIVCLASISGCNSVESQQKRFIESKDRQVGDVFYAHEKEGTREVVLGATTSEFAPLQIPPESGCTVAWLVDTTTRGDYLHPNGMTFQIEGVKKSWRFVGNPDGCRMGVKWGGPW